MTKKNTSFKPYEKDRAPAAVKYEMGAGSFQKETSYAEMAEGSLEGGETRVAKGVSRVC